jgi:PAS domain S-box-containing protein
MGALLVAYTVYVVLKRECDQERLRISEERLGLAVTGTNDGLWDWDIAADRLYYSPRCLELLDVDADQLATNSLAFIKLVHPDDRDQVTTAMRTHFVHRVPYDVGFRVINRDGQEVWLHARGQAVWDQNGRAVRMTGFLTNVSHDKEMERLKSEFVSTVSHELRTPLTSIRGVLALMRGGVLGPLPERAREMAEIAHKNAERLILLISDILDLDKIESGESRFELRQENLNRLLHDAIEGNRAVAVKADVRLVLEPISPAAFVTVDASRFNQAMNHLISNAVKFSPPHGAVIVRAVRREDKLRVSVSDQGPGIPEHFQHRVFAKFAQADSSATRHQQGTGLGLNITQQIVKRLGGQIGFETRAGRGATFWFDLPELAPQAITAKFFPTLAPATQGGGAILICDEDEDKAQVLQTLLIHEGFECLLAHTLADARSLLAERAVAALVLDLTVPDGDGVDLIRSIRASDSGAQLPIIVTSVRAEEGRSALNGGAVGVIDWLKKEIDPAELLAALRRATAHVTSERPSILHLAEDADFHRMIALLLRDKADVIHARTVHESIQNLTDRSFDMLILDISLPDGSGLALLERLGSYQSKLPVLVLSAQEPDETVRERVAASLIKSQASDKKIVDLIAYMATRRTAASRRVA